MTAATTGRRILRGLAIAGAMILLAGAGAAAIGYWKYSVWRGERLDALASGSEIVDTGAGPIEYVLKGDRGPVMLFLHGAPGGYDLSPEPEGGFRVLAPSRPGYLATPLETGRTPRDQARAYAELLDALGVDAPVLVMAASGGGPSGIAFAAMYPDRTLGLIALEAVSQPMTEQGGIPVFLRNDFAIWAVFGAVERLLGDDGVAGMLIADAENRELVLDDPEKREMLVSLIWSVWPISLRNAGWENDVQQFADLALPADDVTVPTLILHGTDDVNVPFSHSEDLARSIAGSRLVTIEDADHMMPITHREEIDSAIDEFLREHALTDFLDRASDR